MLDEVADRVAAASAGGKAEQRAPGVSRVAVAGCGSWGRNLVRSFRSLNALAAVCDEVPARAQEQARLNNTEASSFEAILADPEIDAVALATPAETHAHLALRVINAGKHAFVEKPLALEVRDAEKVRAAATVSGRIVMVGHLLQYHPAFRRLYELVSEGTLGRLQYVYSTRLNLGKFRRKEDVLWSFAPHDISMILSLVGELPESVETTGHCYLHNKIADVTTTHLRFPTGVGGHVFVSWLHPCKEQKLCVIGDAGMAVFDDSAAWHNKLVLYPHRIVWHDRMPEPSCAGAEPISLQQAEPLQIECQHFLDCLRDGRQPRTDAAEGIGVLRVLDAARRSMISGRPACL